MQDILILETSTDTASIALVRDGKIVVEKSFTSDRRHNAMLFKPLAEIIEEFGSRSFDTILIGSGPGSYSGTRVGIAAAQGAALVAGCKAISLPSILATPEALTGKPCLAVGDARRGSYWTAQINENQLLESPSLTDEVGFDVRVEQALADGTNCFSMEIIRNKAIPLTQPSAPGLWEAWQKASPKLRATWASKVPQPIYLAPPHITPSKKQVFG